MIELALVVRAYLIGSLSFAVIVSRAFRLPDPHSYGSGNPGATNVLRTGKKAAAALTLLGDAGKGALAVGLAQAVAARYGAPSLSIPAAALACFAGHLWPVFFGFRGGKGVATAAGILLALAPLMGAAVIATWLAVAIVFRISSVAAIVAAILAPLWYWWLEGVGPGLGAVIVIAALLLYRHQGNIRRILSGEERSGGDAPSA